MGTYTAKYGLYKPDRGERGWGLKINENMDILDAHTHVASDIIGGRLSIDRLPTVELANRFLVVRTPNGSPIYDILRASDIPLNSIGENHIIDGSITTQKFNANAIAPNSDRTDGYHASPTPTPNTIPVSNALGKLDDGWIPNLVKVWLVLNPILTTTWYIPYATNCTALTTLTLTGNRVYYIPFIPKIDCRITELAVEVTTASSGSGQVGVYNSNANYRPHTLLGYISISTGTTGVKSGAVNISLVAGRLYWLAIVNSSGATVRALAVGGIDTILGISTGGTAWNTHYYQSVSSAVLPSPAGANTNGTGSVPAIYIRIQPT